MKNLIDAETTDLVELLRNGPAGHNHTPEQEVNFDAGYTPSPYEPKFLREEWIDGKKYRVFAG